MVRLRLANESGCAPSAGSSDAGAARMAMWSTPPPYCGRVSAPAVRAHTIKLLTASDRQSKSLIASCLPIPRYRDCRVALRLRPQRSDAAGEIDSGAHRDGIAIWKFVGAQGIPVFFSACGQYLPACAARSLYARQVAAPVESGGLVVHSVHHMHASICRSEYPQQISFAGQPRRRIKLGHCRELTHARRQRTGEEVARRSVERTHLRNCYGCRAGTWKYRHCSAAQGRWHERPWIVALATIQRQWRSGTAMTDQARKINIQQVISGRDHPPAQISWPWPCVVDDEHFARLPLSTLQPVQRELFRVEYRDECGRPVFLQHGDVKNRIVLSPQQDLAETEWHGLAGCRRTFGARRGNYHDNRVSRALPNLCDPDVKRWILGQRNSYGAGRRFGLRKSNAYTIQRTPQAVLDDFAIAIAERGTILDGNRDRSRAGDGHYLSRQALLRVAPIDCVRRNPQPKDHKRDPRHSAEAGRHA